MGTSASFVLARKIFACLVAALLSLALVPASALAEGEGSSTDGAEAVASGLPDQSNASADSSLGEPQEISAEQDAEGSPVAPMLASGLVGKPNSFINSDVILDSEPVIGSFTVDGLTFAVIDESTIELVGASEADAGTLMLPESVAYENVNYTLASIAAYAFYLSGVTDVMLPASVSDVDDRAFRSSDVASVAVAEGNQDYSSFDGALYSADKTRLLLIPEGRVGAVLLPREAEVADAGKFSHCSLVDAISVEDGAAFASENGLLYTSDLTTLLRVPAGAIEITIREGCTTIAAGALEACAKLTTINASATVTSISPDVFHAIPTVSLPATSLAESSPQLIAMVALSSTDDDLPEVDPSAITVKLSNAVISSAWSSPGLAFSFGVLDELDSGQIAQTYAASTTTIEIGRLMNIWLTGGSGYVQVTQPTHEKYRYLEYCGAYSTFRFYDGSFWYRNQVGGQIRAGVNASGTGVTSVKYSTSSFGPWTTLPVSADYRTLPYGTWCFALNGSERNVLASWDTNGAGAVSDRLIFNDVPIVSTGALPIPDAAIRGAGWSFDGWFDDESWQSQITTSTTAPARAAFVTYHARWRCDIVWDAGIGAWEDGAKTRVTHAYGADGTGAAKTPAAPVRAGYAFNGWYDSPAGGKLIATDSAQSIEGISPNTRYYAQWTSVIKADVPQAVEAKVDVLGLEEQEPAQSYIMSLCGEPLKVAEVECEPLPGATQVFGANASQVRLEALVGGAAQPTLSFALGASATEGDPTKLAALTMASYGTKVPISYRFAIPDALLPQLKEASASVCRVAYTVGLA